MNIGRAVRNGRWREKKWQYRTGKRYKRVMFKLFRKSPHWSDLHVCQISKMTLSGVTILQGLNFPFSYWFLNGPQRCAACDQTFLDGYIFLCAISCPWYPKCDPRSKYFYITARHRLWPVLMKFWGTLTIIIAFRIDFLKFPGRGRFSIQPQKLICLQRLSTAGCHNSATIIDGRTFVTKLSLYG